MYTKCGYVRVEMIILPKSLQAAGIKVLGKPKSKRQKTILKETQYKTRNRLFADNKTQTY